MATTTRGIPYPDDYNANADVPSVLQNLATTVDDLIDEVDAKATTADAKAATADGKATTASTAVAAHTHNGSGSVAIPLTSVTGLGSALNGKSDSAHTHSIYSLATHTHTSSELAAHTHTDYAAATHTHSQAQSHGTADTDTAQAAIHHTIGLGANQAAAGNHTHSGYASSTHTHEAYAALAHTHSTYSIEGHTHTGYSASDHNHNTSYATLTHNHDSAYSPTTHTHNNYAVSTHDHDGTALKAQSLNVTGAAVTLTGASNNRGATDYDAGFNGTTLRAKGSSQRYKTLISTIDGHLVDVDPTKQHEPGYTNPFDVLDVAVAEFNWLDGGKDTGKRTLGFIAEDVAAKLPIACVFDEQGRADAVKDTAVVAALLAVVRQQQADIADLQSRLRSLESA